MIFRAWLVFSAVAMLLQAAWSASGFDGWTSSGRMQTFKGSELFDHINGGAELFLEFGFEELRVQRFKKGDDEISQEIYRMASPEAALGIYLMKCGKENPDPRLSVRHTVNPFQLTLVKGSYFILTQNFSGNAALVTDMVNLTKAILTAIPDSEPVRLLDLLPVPGRLPGSERIFRGPYALQPIFTFGDGDVLLLEGKAHGVLADYLDEDRHVFTQIFILYPDTAAAIRAFQHLIRHLDSYLTVLHRGESHLIFRDYANKFGVVELIDHWMDIRVHLSRPPTREDRDRLDTKDAR